MMDEIRALHAALNPVETLFIVDAAGQDAVNVAKPSVRRCRSPVGTYQAGRRCARRRSAVGAQSDTEAH